MAKAALLRPRPQQEMFVGAALAGAAGNDLATSGMYKMLRSATPTMSTYAKADTVSS